MTFDRALYITRQLLAKKAVSMRPEELHEYSEVCGAAMEWAKAHKSGKYYDMMYDYLMGELKALQPTGKCCETCRYWEPFTGVCCGPGSPNCADFTDDDDLCAVWRWRLGNDG